MSDLISRQALKNALIDWQMQYAEKDKDTERFETLGQALDLVEQMPTIELRRERDWNGWEDGKGSTYLYDERVLDTQPSIGNIDSTSIVNCGAKMERSD